MTGLSGGQSGDYGRPAVLIADLRKHGGSTYDNYPTTAPRRGPANAIRRCQ